MCNVLISVPDEILLDLHEDKQSFERYMKRKIAEDLYKNRKVSLGHCAALANMSKEDFIRYLGENKVSIFSFDSEAEFLEELKNA